MLRPGADFLFLSKVTFFYYFFHSPLLGKCLSVSFKLSQFWSNEKFFFQQFQFPTLFFSSFFSLFFTCKMFISINLLSICDYDFFCSIYFPLVNVILMSTFSKIAVVNRKAYGLKKCVRTWIKTFKWFRTEIILFFKLSPIKKSLRNFLT